MAYLKLAIIVAAQDKYPELKGIIKTSLDRSATEKSITNQSGFFTGPNVLQKIEPMPVTDRYNPFHF